MKIEIQAAYALLAEWCAEAFAERPDLTHMAELRFDNEDHVWSAVVTSRTWEHGGGDDVYRYSFQEAETPTEAARASIADWKRLAYTTLPANVRRRKEVSGG